MQIDTVGRLLCDSWASCCRAMLCISAGYAVMRCLCVYVCLCVCVSVTFVDCVYITSTMDCVKTNKHTINFFHCPVDPSFYFLCAKRNSNTPMGTPLTGALNAGRQKSRFWAYIWLQCLLLALQQARCCQQGRRWTTAIVSQVMTSLAVSGGVDCGRRRRNVCDMTRSLDVTPKTTEQRM